MEINRRAFVSGVVSSGIMNAAFSRVLAATARPENNQSKRHYFAAARRLGDGRFEGAIFDTAGVDVATVPLPSRGHDVAVRPGSNECVVFARRPGTFAIAFNRADNKPPITFHAAPDRHFYGHGVFSPDGRVLFTTENDYAGERGIIGVRDASNKYSVLGEFPSFGIGPHDIALLSDGHTLVVANGGIVTHPEEGRQMLNLPTMRPNLAYLDTRTGALLERHGLLPELHKLSLRHISVTPKDEVVIGCQFVGAKSETPMLVGTHRRQAPVTLIEAPEPTYRLLRNYVSSIATDRDGRHALATSAKGNTALMIDLERRSIVKSIALADVSGVARGKEAHSFVLSTGEGANYSLTDAQSEPERFASGNYAWDNHLAAL